MSEEKRFVIVSESRGIYLGPNLWSGDKSERNKVFLSRLKFAPAFTAERGLEGLTADEGKTVVDDVKMVEVIPNLAGGNIAVNDQPGRTSDGQPITDSEGNVKMRPGLRSQGLPVWI